MSILKKRRKKVDDGQEDSQGQTDVSNENDKGAPEPTSQLDAKSSDAAVPADEQDDAAHLSQEESILYAKKYLEDLLSFFGLNTDVYATTEEGEVIELQVPSTHLNGFLIGQRGDTMRALQYMVSSALKNNGHELFRVNVDVAEYKKQRAARLVDYAQQWLKTVKDSGKPLDIQPMNSADRRVIHKLAEENGLTTESVGEGRDRHIVLKPPTA